MGKEIESLQNIINVASELIVNYGFQFIGAIIILLIGWQVAKWISKIVLKICQRAQLDITLSSNPVVVNNPAPLVGIGNFGDSAIEIGLRYWVPTRRYYEILYLINREIYAILTQQGIVIPHPQRDIHIVSQKS